MKKNKTILVILFSIFLFNCQEEEKYPISKRYWNTMDYADVIRQIKNDYMEKEILPRFSDPNTRIIIEKLTDDQNYLIVLDDQELGLKHRNKVGNEFFSRLREMDGIYYLRDRKDNFIYEEELIAVSNFGLGLQLKYFDIGNKEIIESADNPNSFQIKNLVSTNINKLISNFTNHLNEINNEKSYSDNGINLYCDGIDLHFTNLIKSNPEGYYNDMERKIENMLNKTESGRIKSSLNKIQLLIDSTKKSSN